MKTDTKALPRAAFPEEVGVQADVLKEFTVFAKENDLEMHSLMVVRHGKVALEWYNEPFDADTPHALYSISKSITATAVGLAIDEGLFSLDDLVVDFFPEYAPKKDHPYFKKLTVRNLLTMTSGKQTDMLVSKGKIDWIENYINAPWIFEPGTDFLYVNENIFMLCAIIERRANMCVTDYLMPRLFEPLGIERPFWETDQKGIEAGGWGLQLKTEDLAKIADCYLHEGKYQGKQIIPKWWTQEATHNQLGEVKQRSLDPGYNSGYGYCFWVNDTEQFSYRMDGMFSQFAINFPSYDATVVLTAAVAVEKRARLALWHFFPAAFIDEEKKEVHKKPDNAHVIEAVPSSNRSTLEQKIAGRTIKMNRKILLNIIGMPVSMLPLSVTYMMANRAGNIDHISFRFGEHDCTMDWDERKEHNSVVCGMDGHYRYGTMTLGGQTFKVCANAYWLSKDTLKISVRPIETVGKRTLKFHFKKCGRVTMKPGQTPTTVQICETLKDSIPEIIDNPIIAKIGERIIGYAPILVDAKHRGRFID